MNLFLKYHNLILRKKLKRADSLQAGHGYGETLSNSILHQ